MAKMVQKPWFLESSVKMVQWNFALIIKHECDPRGHAVIIIK
jgi:hypothetical protein